jgi:hypothetical protein
MRASSAWQDNDLIFCRADGTPWPPDHVSREWKRYCAAAGVRVIKMHEGRHSAASLARDAGVDPKLRREQLGHTTDKMTDHYTHVLAEAHLDAAERVARLVDEAGAWRRAPTLSPQRRGGRCPPMPAPGAQARIRRSAEGVGFEPTRTRQRPSSFQDYRHRPLGEPSRRHDSRVGSPAPAAGCAPAAVMPFQRGLDRGCATGTHTEDRRLAWSAGIAGGE